RLRVPEGAEVDAIDVEVAHDREIAIDLEQGVDALEVFVERAHRLGMIRDRFPQRGLPGGVHERGGLLKIPEPFVADGQFAIAPIAAQVGPELIDDRIARLFVRRRDLPRVSSHKDRVPIRGPQANPLYAVTPSFAASGGRPQWEGRRPAAIGPATRARRRVRAGRTSRAGGSTARPTPRREPGPPAWRRE